MFGKQRKVRRRPKLRSGDIVVSSRQVGKRPRFASVINPQLTTLRDLNYFDGNLAQTLTSGSASLTNLFLPTTGSTSVSRYGDKTIIKSISYNIFVNPVAGVGACRVILFYDRQTNGAAPVAPDPLIANGAHTFKNPDKRHRYLILRDWTLAIDDTNASLADPKRDYIQKGSFTCNLPTLFTASAGAITDIATGSLYMYFYQAIGSSVGVEGTVRCLFQS